MAENGLEEPAEDADAAVVAEAENQTRDQCVEEVVNAGDLAAARDQRVQDQEPEQHVEASSVEDQRLRSLGPRFLLVSHRRSRKSRKMLKILQLCIKMLWGLGNSHGPMSEVRNDIEVSTNEPNLRLE